MVVNVVDFASVFEKQPYHAEVIFSCRVVDCSLPQSVLEISRDSSIDEVLCHLHAFLLVFDQSSKENWSLFISFVLDLLGIYVKSLKLLFDSS